MVMSNHQRVGDALEILRKGVPPFVLRELKTRYKVRWWVDGVEPALTDRERVDARSSGGTQEERFQSLDIQKLLRVMWNRWNEVFHLKLDQIGRTYVGELREVRNRWTHQQPFSLEDTYRTLDTMTRFLRMVASNYIEETARIAREVLRLLSEEESKREVRRGAQAPVKVATPDRLGPRRDVPTSHPDVTSSGRRAMASAADVYAEILLPYFRSLGPAIHPWWWPKEGGRDLGDWGLTKDRIAKAGCDADAVFKSLSQGPKGARSPALIDSGFLGFAGGIAAKADDDGFFVWVLSVRPSDEPFPNHSGGSATKLRDVLKGAGLFERAHMTDVVKFRGSGPGSLAEEGLGQELPGGKTVLEASLACLFNEHELLPPRVVLVAGRAAQDWLRRHRTANDLLNDLWRKMKPVPSWLASNVDQATIVSEWARAAQ